MITIYLDACCLNRPFDDQTQDRIRIETEAIILIFKHIKVKKLELIGSDILAHEVGKITDIDRKLKVQFLMKNIAKNVCLSENIKKRALVLESLGFKGFDALHIASAENGKVSVFLTTDDKLLKLSRKNQEKICIKIDSPISWITELFEL